MYYNRLRDKKVVFKGKCIMLNVFKKEDKNPHSFLPKHLHIGAKLNFNGLEFYGKGIKSKFIFEKEGSEVEKIGVIHVKNTMFVILYLKSLEEQDAFIKIRYEDREMKAASLYVNYDYVYPEDRMEWDYWLGRGNLKGIIGSDNFIVDEEPLEKIGRILLKIGKNLYDAYISIDDFEFIEENAYIATNIMEKIAEREGRSYNEVKGYFENRLEDEDWFLDIQKEGELTAFYYNFSEAELQTEYYNIYGDEGKKFSYKERIYYQNEAKAKLVHESCEKTAALYSRAVDDEFYEEEYMFVAHEKSEGKERISINLGIPIQLNNLKNTKGE